MVAVPLLVLWCKWSTRKICREIGNDYFTEMETSRLKNLETPRRLALTQHFKPTPHSNENSKPHTPNPAQHPVHTLPAPLVDDVDSDAEAVATTTPVTAALTSCPSTLFASPPTLTVCVYTANTLDETSLAVIVSDSNVKVCTLVELGNGSNVPSKNTPSVAALIVWPWLTNSGPPGASVARGPAVPWMTIVPLPRGKKRKL
jgi:hypothetical protein